MPGIYVFEVRGGQGYSVLLDRYRDRVLLIVIPASFCAFTPQFGELVALHKYLGPAGLTVLAFPCN